MRRRGGEEADTSCERLKDGTGREERAGGGESALNKSARSYREHGA